MARRRSSLRPIGLELFFIHPHPHPHPHAHGAGHGAGQGQFEAGLRGWGAAAAEAAGTVEVSGPLWDAPSAFFAFRCVQALGSGLGPEWATLALRWAGPAPPGAVPVITAVGPCARAPAYHRACAGRWCSLTPQRSHTPTLLQPRAAPSNPCTKRHSYTPSHMYLFRTP